ncbi:MAG: hypothetical protein ACREKL_03640, partial [Chthoniobacterales bacterium]
MKNRTQKSAALIGAGAVGLAAGAQADMHYTDAGGYTGSTIYFDLETGQFGANNVAVPGADFYLTASQTTGQDINEPKNTKTKQQYIVNSADGVAAIQTNFGNNAPERFDLNASVTPGAPSTTSG